MKDRRIKLLKTKLTQLKGAEISYKPEWGADVVRIGGKMFGYIGDDNKGTQILTVKGEPDYNELWRTRFPESAIPGYYMNKTHWNSYLLESEELEDADFLEVFEAAYKLQVSQLTKKCRSELGL